MTPEGKIKDAVKKILLEHGVLWYMPVQQGYGAQSLDFLCWTKQGYPFVIETKADPTKKPTQRQYATAMDFIAHGVPVFLIRDKEAEHLRIALLHGATMEHRVWAKFWYEGTRGAWGSVMRAHTDAAPNAEGEE